MRDRPWPRKRPARRHADHSFVISSGDALLASRFLDVAAEFVTHGGKQFVGKIRLAPRTEAFVKSGRQDMRRHRLIDRRLDRPAALTRIRDPASEARERGVFSKRA